MLVDPIVIEAMREVGIDIRRIHDEIRRRVDFVGERVWAPVI